MLVAMPANVEGRRGPYMPCAPANADSFWAGSLVTALPAMQLSARVMIAAMRFILEGQRLDVTQKRLPR